MPQPANRRFVTEAALGVALAKPATIATLPAGVALMTSGTTRPTTRTDLPVTFTGADPGANALPGDVWMPA